MCIITTALECSKTQKVHPKLDPHNHDGIREVLNVSPGASFTCPTHSIVLPTYTVGPASEMSEQFLNNEFIIMLATLDRFSNTEL